MISGNLNKETSRAQHPLVSCNNPKMHLNSYPLIVLAIYVIIDNNSSEIKGMRHLNYTS